MSYPFENANFPNPQLEYCCFVRSFSVVRLSHKKDILKAMASEIYFIEFRFYEGLRKYDLEQRLLSD